MGDIERFVQLIPGLNKSDKPNKITGIDKVRLKCDCVNGSILDGVWQPILYSFALDKPPGHKLNIEPRIKLFKKITKSVLTHITFYFYLEDDDHKLVDFNGEAISFTCQLIKN